MDWSLSVISNVYKGQVCIVLVSNIYFGNPCIFVSVELQV